MISEYVLRDSSNNRAGNLPSARQPPSPPPPHPPSPSCSQFKVSQRPNSIDPDLNPALQPLRATEDRRCLLPNMHCRLCRKEETLCKARQTDRRMHRIRTWARTQWSYLQLTMLFCGEASLNLLLNNWLPQPCSNTPETLLWFVHKMSALQISLSERYLTFQPQLATHKMLPPPPPFLSYLVLLSDNNNLQLTFIPLWIIQILFSYQGRSQARQLSFICVLCQSKA